MFVLFVYICMFLSGAYFDAAELVYKQKCIIFNVLKERLSQINIKFISKSIFSLVLCLWRDAN